MKTECELVIRGGIVINADHTITADIGIRDGKVVAIGERIDAHEIIDATGQLVLPGLVDGHVHFREPGFTQKEDFSTGSRAAAAGGVTTVLDMPNTVPAVASVKTFVEKRNLVSRSAYVDFGLFAMLSESSIGEIGALAHEGAAGLKLFMGETTGNNACPPDGAIFTGLVEAKKAGLVVGAHAENDSILHYLRDQLRNEGRTDPIAHLESRPDFVEEEAVQRFLTMAIAANARVHLHHISSRRGLDAAIAARARGAQVSVEVLIAHLLLDIAAYDTYGPLIKLNPPIRPTSDRDYLRQALRPGGSIDSIGSDHAPHVDTEKRGESIWDVASGFIGVETMLPLLLSEVSNQVLSMQDVVRLCSTRPAEIWNLNNKGRLAVGYDADLVIIDPAEISVIDATQLHSKYKVTPFDGWKVAGKIVRTVLRGKTVCMQGEIVGLPQGQMVKPVNVRLETPTVGESLSASATSKEASP